MDAGKRLKDLRKSLGLTQTEFAEKLGFKWHKIKDMETNKQKIDPLLAERLENDFSISGWWLLTGKGEKFINQIDQDNNTTIPITKLSVTASAGGGNHLESIDVYDTKEVMHIDKGIFKTPPKGKLAILKVDGYSMVPVLYPDSWVIFEEQHQFVGDGLYILNFDNTLMVKIIQADIITGKLAIISSNKDYKSYTYDPKTDQSAFKIIGKVLRVII